MSAGEKVTLVNGRNSRGKRQLSFDTSISISGILVKDGTGSDFIEIKTIFQEMHIQI